jgi:hypothetical protein
MHKHGEMVRRRNAILGEVIALSRVGLERDQILANADRIAELMREAMRTPERIYREETENAKGS